MHERSVRDLLNLYNPANPLEKAWTIPAPWYFDERMARLERDSVFAANWQVAGHLDQVKEPGQFFTIDVNNEPLVIVRSDDGKLRAFYNVCRHHAAAVVRADYGLVPVRVDTWENFIFVNLDGRASSLREFLGKVPELVAPLKITETMKYFDRRIYTLNCNWKVYVDNYLDGGYHVPHAHKGLSSVVEYTKYTIENFDRACLQSSPLDSSAALESSVGSTRQGTAFYLWVYPNFMLNAYSGVMDTNLVLPLGVSKCAVIFDYYFADTSAAAAKHHQESIAVSEKVQDEDMAICDSVQRGLSSRAYVAGRLSLRREAGEHLFHRLLHADMTNALARPMAAD
jgi:choline monooxygenase